MHAAWLLMKAYYIGLRLLLIMPFLAIAGGVLGGRGSWPTRLACLALALSLLHIVLAKTRAWEAEARSALFCERRTFLA